MSAVMRPSRVLKRLRAGDVVSCFKLNLADARAADIASMAGFDCIWLDHEHVPNDLAANEQAIWVTRARDVDAMVRVSRGSYSDYIRPLEMDASGIMVPHVMSLDDVRNVVRMTRFHPLGRRPVDGGNADGAYGEIELADYLRQANQERFLAIQIEDPEPLNDLDAIAAVEGVDILFFGPADFSHAIGVPGQWDHPRITEVRELVAATALKHGKFAGTVASPDSMDGLIAMGYRFLNMGADVAGLSQYCKSMAAHLSGRQNPGSKSIYGGKAR